MEEYTTKAGLAITQRDSSRVAVEISTGEFRLHVFCIFCVVLLLFYATMTHVPEVK